jgi:hypothetical protein
MISSICNLWCNNFCILNHRPYTGNFHLEHGSPSTGTFCHLFIVASVEKNLHHLSFPFCLLCISHLFAALVYDTSTYVFYQEAFSSKDITSRMDANLEALKPFFGMLLLCF